MKIFCPKFFYVILAHALCSSSLIHIGESTTTFRAHACSNSSTGSTLTQNSTYLNNLNLLFSYLTTNATNDGDFYQTTVARDTPDASTGYFQCRLDINATVCQECVRNASTEALKRCPLEKGAIIWFDECWIRYQDGSSVSPGLVPALPLSNVQNVTEAERFNQLLGDVLNKVADQAVSSESAKKYATEEENFTSSQTLYSLAQCSSDAPTSFCNTCLLSAIGFIPGCCGGRRGGAVYLPSCIIRFELYPFYNSISVTPIPPPVREEISGGDTFQFSLEEIRTATNNFLDENKIGRGGFGAVYKGTLPNGHEIAVKRLTGNMGKGADEQFKNEALLMTKLQHRNLARLIGFCLEGQEKILVYEYVPNKSLDFFLFDQEKKNMLDWTTRYKIITGVARGILYLHEDSRLKIIHRDLKASNVLLDDHMNPKISDFGLAKVFVVDQTHGSTNRIVGTYGYMSPEYAMHGKFSFKSDVFSFGVLVLEILSGKRNNFSDESSGSGDLLSYAWELWKEGTFLELLDPTLRNSYSKNEVIRCIHMGLLCVQENPVHRPTMATIVLMLNSYSAILPPPQQPAVLSHRNRTQSSTTTTSGEQQFYESMASSTQGSTNDRSMITEIYPR
ncbi:cysteine-rich receptor-like protein kinase 44 isoform X3 [Cannabis sativa]|uniref:cysteine-rich receptor-like protein kinase 44 isoform X3 n=1 Tax=Cannabis sativa TaxID=3483 RepID=UPI0029CA7A69|nr:cysteine-rich receptor-like protein kinase 44 isoform X3 [Cannabis sativa]